MLLRLSLQNHAVQVLAQTARCEEACEMTITYPAHDVARHRHGGATIALPAFPGTHDCLGAELRDGLLQDLVAVDLLVRAARHDLVTGRSDAEALLTQVNRTLDGNLAQVRRLIDRLAGQDRVR